MNIWEGARMWVIDLDHEAKSYERWTAMAIFQYVSASEILMNKRKTWQYSYYDINMYLCYIQKAIWKYSYRHVKIHPNVIRGAERIRASRWASPRESLPQGSPLLPAAGEGRSPLQRIFDTGLADRQSGHVWSPGRKPSFFPYIDIAMLCIFIRGYKDIFMIYVLASVPHVHASCDPFRYSTNDTIRFNTINNFFRLLLL